jgi:hypothetical protein
MKCRFILILVGIQLSILFDCYSQGIDSLKSKSVDKFQIKELINRDSVSSAKAIVDFSILEIFSNDSMGIFMFLENSPHSHRYILFYERGAAKILWDKKYRSAKVLEEEVDNFIIRNEIKKDEKRKIRKIFAKIYKNLRKLYGKHGDKNYYRI